MSECISLYIHKQSNKAFIQRRSMKTLFTYIYLSFISVALISLIGCSGSSSDKLDSAFHLINERPDSAYTILRDIDYRDLSSDSLRAKYILAKAWTNIRVGRSLITDTLLNDAASYYISAGDTAKWVMASQLLSGYDFMKGDAESALRRLENMLPRIKNPELRWDTYIHLLELSMNSGNFSSTCNYADWLLNHTDVPEHLLKFAVAKGGAQYMQGHHNESLALFDSIISTGVVRKVSPGVAGEFYEEYAEILDGAGYASEAIDLIDSLYNDNRAVNDVEKVKLKLTRAQFYANAGNAEKAKKLLGSINHEGTKSVFEIYASIAMLRAALEFKETGVFPSHLMHKVSKNMQMNYQFAQFDRQTAMESVIELSDDNYELKLQRQRLWLMVLGVIILLIAGGVAVYIILSRRRQRMVEAEERVETLERMLNDTERAEEAGSVASDNAKLKAALLRQLGIFRTFAATPTPHSRDALKKISSVGNDKDAIESLVDWPEFYSMIDNLYDGFHAKLLRMYPDTFNDKEQQIIVLLKADFSTKEIGVLTEQSSATIYTRKSVIRKKLSAAANGDIVDCLDGKFKGV